MRNKISYSFEMFNKVYQDGVDMQKAHNTWHDALPAKFKVEQHFLEQLNKANTHDFFRILIGDILPLMRAGPGLEPYCLQWEDQEQEHRKKYGRLQKKAIKDIKSCFAQLKLDLSTADLINAPILQPNITALAKIIEVHFPALISSSLIYDAHDYFKALCAQVADLGRVDLIKNHVEIVYIEKYKTDEVTGRLILIDGDPSTDITYKEPAIFACLFAPAVYELKRLDALFFADNVRELWVAWYYIKLAEWCWNLPQGYFDKEKVDLENSYSHSIYLINACTLRAEMNCIKERRDVNLNTSFFKKSRFEKYLNLIIGQISKDQEINKAASEKLAIANEPARPHAIEMRLDGNELLLDIEWVAQEEHETRIIHKFIEDSSTHQFINRVVDAEADSVIDIEDKHGSIAKYYTRTKLKGILADLFFTKCTERKSNSIIFNGARLILDKRPRSQLIALRKKIDALAPYL